MTSRSCHLSPAPVPPLEDDDLLSEILLRLPPQPSSLPRASLVCKRWRCLVSDPRFCRRFRCHHRRNPPLLGFFNRDSDLFPFVPSLEPPNLVWPGRFSLQRGEGDRFISLGCRHGLVLAYNVRPNQILVWDPVTGKRHDLAIPPGLVTHAEKTTINGAVLRAAGDIQQFHVVLTLVDNVDKQHKRALACLYSSETDLWGHLVSTPVPTKVSTSDILSDEDDITLVFTGKPAVMVRDSLYWILAGNFVGILEFDLEKQSLAVIRVPAHMLEIGYYQFWIMRAEGGGLGLLLQKDQSFQLWKRKTDCDGVASWVLGRTIELEKLLSLNGNGSQVILGFAEENNVVFVWTHGVVFMVHLESLQFKKLGETRTFLTIIHSKVSTLQKQTSVVDMMELIFHSTLDDYLVRYATVMYLLSRYLGLRSGGCDAEMGCALRNGQLCNEFFHFVCCAQPGNWPSVVVSHEVELVGLHRLICFEFTISYPVHEDLVTCSD